MLYSSFCQIVLSVVYIHLFDSYLIHTRDFDKNDHIVNIDCRVSFFIFTFLVGGVPWDFYQGKRGSKQLKTLVWRKQFTVSWTGHLDLRADDEEGGERNRCWGNRRSDDGVRSIGDSEGPLCTAANEWCCRAADPFFTQTHLSKLLGDGNWPPFQPSLQFWGYVRPSGHHTDNVMFEGKKHTLQSSKVTTCSRFEWFGHKHNRSVSKSGTLYYFMKMWCSRMFLCAASMNK